MIPVCDIRPQKTETHITRLTAGGYLIYYPGEVRTPTSYLTRTKLHVNSVIYKIKPRYMCMEVKYVVWNNRTDREEYIIIQISTTPQ